MGIAGAANFFRDMLPSLSPADVARKVYMRREKACCMFDCGVFMHMAHRELPLSGVTPMRLPLLADRIAAAMMKHTMGIQHVCVVCDEYDPDRASIKAAENQKRTDRLQCAPFDIQPCRSLDPVITLPEEWTGMLHDDTTKRSMYGALVPSLLYGNNAMSGVWHAVVGEYNNCTHHFVRFAEEMDPGFFTVVAPPFVMNMSATATTTTAPPPPPTPVLAEFHLGECLKALASPAWRWVGDTRGADVTLRFPVIPPAEPSEDNNNDDYHPFALLQCTGQQGDTTVVLGETSMAHGHAWHGPVDTSAEIILAVLDVHPLVDVVIKAFRIGTCAPDNDDDDDDDSSSSHNIMVNLSLRVVIFERSQTIPEGIELQSNPKEADHAVMECIVRLRHRFEVFVPATIDTDWFLYMIMLQEYLNGLAAAAPEIILYYMSVTSKEEHKYFEMQSVLQIPRWQSLFLLLCGKHDFGDAPEHVGTTTLHSVIAEEMRMTKTKAKAEAVGKHVSFRTFVMKWGVP